MSLPASFKQLGFMSAANARPERGLMLSLEGPRDSGKTEFALSAPGPGAVLCLDRGFDAVLDNPNPPSTRQENFGFKVIKVPKPTQAKQEVFVEYWLDYRKSLYAMLDSKDCRTVVMDGDGPDSWELQRMAAFGKLAQVPRHLYNEVNGARRALYARCYDSRKIVIGTSKIKKQYVDVLDAHGKVVVGDDGKPQQVWNGEWERQGFADQSYVWAVELFCMYNEEKQRHGVKILSAKAQLSLRGQEFWGDECNFATVMEAIYPNVDPSEWGY